MKTLKTSKPAPPVKALIDLVGVAAHFRVTTRGLRKWVDVGLFPAPMRIGRRLRWSVEELNEWIEAGCPPANKRK